MFVLAAALSIGMLNCPGFTGAMDYDERKQMLLEDEPWIPLGPKALVRGKIADEEVMVNIGKNIFIPMSREEAWLFCHRRLGKTDNLQHETIGHIDDTKDEGIEIREDLTTEDLKTLEAKGKARVAHQLIRRPTFGEVVSQSRQSIEKQMASLTVDPVKEHVVERKVLSTSAGSLRTITKSQSKVSIFGRAASQASPLDSAKVSTHKHGRT